jgi:hypothetical protein
VLVVGFVNSTVFLIPNFRRVLTVVCFLLGNFLASEFYMPKFRNNFSVPSSQAGEDGTECSEMSAYKIQTPGNYPEESIKQSTVLFRFRKKFLFYCGAATQRGS